jgi:uncharacterized protein YndB with AHSA1/START domain
MPDHATLTLERDIACAPDRLFHVLTTRDLRQQWAAPDNDSVLVIDHFDLRPGGREEIRCGPRGAPDFATTGHFHVVAPDFLSFTETLTAGGQMLSISLCSHEIRATGRGCLLRVTLQITSLAGAGLFDEYRGGWSAALDKLAALACQPR